MISSPLHLDSYFFTKIQVEACSKGSEKPGEGVISSQVHCFKHKEAERKWMVQLGLRQTQDKEKGCPEYTFHMEVVGLFEVAKTYAPEKAEMLVHANGPAVLFGAIREMLATLTARGPFAPVKLPTVSFIDEWAAKQKKTEGARKAEKKQNARAVVAQPMAPLKT